MFLSKSVLKPVTVGGKCTNMPVIGVAGKYCSGKNTVTGLLETKGYVSIDVDKAGHQALSEKTAELVEAFGSGIVQADGTIDRKRLGTIVFDNPHNLKRLESIIHPRMITIVQGRKEVFQKEGLSKIVINAAILFHLGLQAECDFVLWITAPLPCRMMRAKQRDNLTFFQVIKRFWAQRSLSPQSSEEGVDIYTIKNSGKPGRMKMRVEEILSKEEAG